MYCPFPSWPRSHRRNNKPKLFGSHLLYHFVTSWIYHSTRTPFSGISTVDEDSVALADLTFFLGFNEFQYDIKNEMK
jgi:hypothetical protein